jgi:hypothetical protein
MMPPEHEFWARQVEQDDLPVVAVYVPEAQTVATPLLQDDPIGQVMQLDWPVLGWYDPAAHC